MFTILGRPQRFCDGLSRRGFLKVGALGVGGLTLANLLRAEALAGSVGDRPSRKSIINIYLPGGPSHQDMFDLKPQAPLEFRGEFHPIATTVPGMEICQHFPKLAERGEKFAVVRSITDVREEHSQNQSDSGWSDSSLRTIGGRPGIGAVLSKVHGPSNGNAPTFVSLTGFGEPGFLGSIHGPYRPDGPGRENLRLQRSITVDRLNDRKKLLEGLDALRRDVDAKGMMDAMAKELGNYNIRVNILALGILEGGASRKLSHEVTDAYLKHCSLGRFGKAEEAAEFAAWMALENTYITGQVLILDGGL